MKRKIIMIIIALVLILPFNVKAGANDGYIDWYLERSIFAHQYRNGEDHITNLAWMTVGSMTAYCIEPGVLADKQSFYSSSKNIADTPLGNIDVAKLSLIGYYGYGYSDHSSTYYYMATQELIWRYMGVENVWWTDQKEGGNTFNIENEKNEIMRLVNRHYITPEFNFKNEYIIGDEIEANDMNNIIDEYEVKNGNVSINGNSLKINIESDNNTFTLKRKSNGITPTFYYKDGYQTIGVFKGTYDYEKTYEVKGIYGKITIEKLDNDTKTNKSISKIASLENAKYGLYDENKDLITTLNTNKDGVLTFSNLTRGNYYIKELEPSTGYTVDEKFYSIKLDSDNIVNVIKSYENIIKNKIVITKVLDDTDENKCTPEEGILFSVYDLDGNFVTKDVTDEKGNVIFNLNYGDYIIKQESTFDGVDVSDDINISVRKNNVTQNLAVVNHPIKEETYEIISTKPKINYLPKTGKKSILYTLIMLIVSICLLKY